MRKILVCLAAMLLFTGCTREDASETLWQQEISHLYPFSSAESSAPPEAEAAATEASEEPEEVLAVWIPVMQYADWMTGKTEGEFRQSVQAAFRSIAEYGLNTVFLHVRAYGDAYYPSELFPQGAYLTGDYDPLAIMVEEARKQGLSPHAWINPMRLQTAENLARTDSRFPIRQWHDDPNLNGTWLVNVDGRFWLNPAYPEVRQLIADGVSEILDNYDVDGIHIDDYFYPTQDESFDAQAFGESGASDLAQWRRENTSEMVKLLHDTVKSHDPALVFSVSPQGNLATDYETLYADAARWSSEPGFADWIVPQIYYGFENAACPFAETLALWQDKATASKLIIGLAPYKIGTEDVWAGSGADEWLTDGEVLSRELALALEEADGAAFYSFASLFEPEPTVERAVTEERERIRRILEQ